MIVLRYVRAVLILLVVILSACEPDEEEKLVVTIDPTADEGPFEAPIDVNLESSIEDTIIYYTIDDTSPSSSDTREIYSEDTPISISALTYLRVYAEVDIEEEGDVPGQNKIKTLSYGPVVEVYEFLATEDPISSKFTAEMDCVEAGFYWYKGSCHNDPESEEESSAEENQTEESTTEPSLTDARSRPI